MFSFQGQISDIKKVNTDLIVSQSCHLSYEIYLAVLICCTQALTGLLKGTFCIATDNKRITRKTLTCQELGRQIKDYGIYLI